MGIRAPSAGEQQGTIEVSGETLLGPRLWRGKGGGGGGSEPHGTLWNTSYPDML